MNASRSALVASAAVAGIVGAYVALRPAARDAALLRRGWNPGTNCVLRAEVNQDIRTSDSSNAAASTQRIRQSFDVSVSVLKKDGAGSVELEMECLRAAVRSDWDDMSAAFDTDWPPDRDAGNPLAVLRAVVGKKVRLRLDAAGRLAGTDDATGFLDKTAAGSPAMRGMVRGLFGGESLGQIFANDVESDWLPARPVRRGGRWTVERRIPLSALGYYRTTAAYRFRGREKRGGRECAVVEFSGRAAGKPVSGSAAPVEAKDGRLDGVIWFDTAAGIPVETRATHEATFLFTMDNPSGGRDLVTSRVKARIRVELLATKNVQAPAAVSP